MLEQIKLPNLDELTPKDLLGKTIFIRVDFNVPLTNTDKGYRVADDTRIRRFLDLTFKKIHQLTGGNCRIIIGSHLGRPHKKKDHLGWDGIFNIQFVCSHFDTLIRKLYDDTYSIFPPEITDSHLKHSLEICSNHQLPLGGIKFLPNLRYLLDPNNPDDYRKEFIEELGNLADVFINCAFGCSHRISKSIRMLPQFMRQKGKIVSAGKLLNQEVTELGRFGHKLLQHPKKTAIIAGGAKIADKIGILKQFVESQIRLIFVGGRMVNAFLLAKKLKHVVHNISLEDIPSMLYKNKTDDECQVILNEIKYADEIIKLAEQKEVDIVYPDDYKITQDYSQTHYTVKNEPDFSTDFQLDLGPETIKNYSKNILLNGEIDNVFWNGPLGAYDHPQSEDYGEGSRELAKVLIQEAVKDQEKYHVIGGGDSAAILNQLKFDDLKNLIKEQLNHQLNSAINKKLVNIGFTAEDTYTLCNYFTSNFFVSTGGGASLEFLEAYLKDRGKSPIASYLPGTATLLELVSP